MSDIPMTFAERFKKAREFYLELKQKDLASALGVSPSHISGIESGKKVPSDRLVELFCIKFHISKEWLLNGSGDAIIPPSDFEPFKVDKENDYETATGYVVRYMQLLKFFCVAGDINKKFDELTNDSNLEILLNYIIEKYLYCSENEISFAEEFTEVLSEVIPDYSEYVRTYIRRKTDALANSLKHHPLIWELAENVESILEPKSEKLLPYKVSDLMVAEEKLFTCNISGMLEMYSDKLFSDVHGENS